MDFDLSKIRIGDIVYLTPQQSEGLTAWLCASGHLDDNVFLTSDNSNFFYGLFEVCVQNQYGSMNEYDEAILVQNIQDSLVATKSHSNSDQFADMLHQLEKAAMNEQILNEKLMQSKIGTPIIYGDVFQLRHVASRKFLTVSTVELATQERENMRVSCILNGSPYSCLSIQPKISYTGESGTIADNSECYIRVIERPGEYLRCAKQDSKGGESNGEVNCSLERTAWTVNVFQNIKYPSKTVLTGSAISLSDSETFSFLSINENDLMDEGLHSNASARGLMKPPVIVSGEQELHVTVNSLWRIEKRNLFRGGPIKLGTDRVLLCHLNTGLYLTGKTNDGTLQGVRDRLAAGEFVMDVHMDSPQASVDPGPSGYSLEEGSTITLSSVAAFGKNVSTLYLTYDTDVDKSKLSGLEGMLSTTQQENQAIALNTSGNIQKRFGSDIFFGIEAARCMERFRVLAAQVSADDAFDSANMVAAIHAYHALLRCLDLLTQYLSNGYIAEGFGSKKNKRHSFGLECESASQLRARQSMIREQSVLDIIMDILDECLHNTYDNMKVSHAGSTAAFLQQSKATAKGDMMGIASQNAMMRSHSNLSTDRAKASGDVSNTPKYGSFNSNNQGNKGSSLEMVKPKDASSSMFGQLFGDRQKSVGDKKKKTRESLFKRLGSTIANTFRVNRVAVDEDSESESSSSSSSSDDDDEEPRVHSTGAGGDFTNMGNGPNTGNGNGNDNGEEKQSTVVSFLDMLGFSGKKAPEDTTRNVYGTIQRGTTTRRMSASTALMKRRASTQQATSMDQQMHQQMMMRGNGTKMFSPEVQQSNKNKELIAKRESLHRELSEALLKVLLLAISKHTINQLHISDRLSVLLNHIDTQEFAVNCLQELFRDNVSILQTKIRQSEINIFVRLLGQVEMNVSFLKLMQETCACPFGIDSTQRMVAMALWGNEHVVSKVPSTRRIDAADQLALSATDTQDKQLMIHVFLQYPEEKKLVTWVRHGVFSYFPDASSSDFDEDQTGILGFNMLTNGLGIVNASWTDYSATGARSMIKLFGMPDMVDLVTLSNAYVKNYSNYMKIRELNEKANKKLQMEQSRRTSSNVTSVSRAFSIAKQKTNTRGYDDALDVSDEYKIQVSEYLLAELYLVADLCLDRNYVAIGILEEKFPYDLLITVLRDDQIKASFKAPICRILRCLWIDREPQTEAVFPRLIRSSTINGVEDTDNEFNKHHSGSAFAFCLLQQTISDYFRLHFDRENCDELSAEMIETCYMLMNFGFYSDIAQISDLVKPLMFALDHTKKLFLSANDELMLERDQKDRERRREERLLREQALAQGDLEAEELAEATRRKSSAYLMFASIGSYFTGSEQVAVEGNKEDVDDTLDGHPVYKTHRQMQKATREAAENKLSKGNTREGAILAFTESITGMVLIMMVVVVAVVISIYTVVTGDNDDILETIALVCTIIFIIDIAIRGYCASKVREGGLIPYFMEPLNFLDLALVILDIVLLALGDTTDGDGATASAGKLARNVKVVRFLRMARLLRVFRLMQIIREASRAKHRYKLPERYLNCPKDMGNTMTTILKTLTLVYNRIQDHSLAILIKAFQQCVEMEKEGQYVDTKQVIRLALASDDAMGLIPQGFDNVLADLIMYDNPDLTNEALRLLMLHKNKKHILLDLSKDIQIVYSPKVEAKLSDAKKNLLAMRAYAEKYEIWQDLKTDDDLNTAGALKQLIKDMTNLMHKVNEERTLAIKMEHIPDEEVQNLLRNLDAMNAFMTVLEALHDGGREEPPEQIKEIMKDCMSMVRMYVVQNSRNQAVAYDKLQFFIDRVDDGLQSAQVVQCILDGNSELIKQCHKRCVDWFAQKIFLNGRKAHYMRIFEGLTGSVEADSGMKAVHHNISRYLTSREWQPRILMWCCSPDTPEYEERVAFMEPLLETERNGGAVSEDDMPDQLRYHVSLLNVLSKCSLGPKLQAIYQFDDIVHAIIDKKTAFVVRIALVKAMEQLICNGAAHYIQSEYIWRFFDDFVIYLDDLTSRMDRIFRRPYSSEIVLMKIQLGEWLESCLSVITVYFAVLDMQMFGVMLYENDSMKLTQRLEADVLITIKRLYNGIRVFHDRYPLYLGNTVQDRCNYALVSLSRHSDALNYDYNGPDMILRNSKKTQRSSVTLADVQQLQLRHKFTEFVNTLQDSDLISNQDSIDFFMNIPTIDSGGDHDVRLEPLIGKLVSHIRSCIKTNLSNSRTLTMNLHESVWLLRTFRLLFEQFLSISIESLLDVNMLDVKNNGKVKRWRKLLNETGITSLCMDFIAIGMDSNLCIEAINLLVVLLAEPGGSKEVQQTILKYLKDNDSSPFFLQLKELINEIFTWYQKEAENVEVVEDFGDSVLVLPDQSVVFTLIQLICEGDQVPLKNYFREQDGNSESVSIPLLLANILDFLSRRESALFTNVSITVVKTIRATLHGPCKENQRYYIMNTEVLVSLNRIIRSSRPKTQTLTLMWNVDIEMLKECIVDLLRSVVEGFARDSLIFDRIISSIELNVTSMLLMPPSDENQDVLEYGFTSLESKYMVFLRTVDALDYESSLSSAVLIKQKESISFVEIRWQKATHKIFFSKPAILDDLSTDYLLQFFEIDSASQEDKLVMFLEKTCSLHTEAKHQQLLKQYGLSYLWSRRRNISLFMFINAMACNMLLLLYYERDRELKTGSSYSSGYSSYDDDHRRLAASAAPETDDLYVTNLHVNLPGDVNDSFTALIIIHIILSILMAVLYITVRMPSNYLSKIQNGNSVLEALASSIMDPMPLWYIILLLASILSYTLDKVFCCLFLLEFVVLDSTTQYLLKAVQHPFRQLVATLIILVVAIYVFTGLYFETFPYEMENNMVEPIYDLWSALKMALTYGLRGEYGVDHEFYVTIGRRMWLDLAFYFVILATLRHIFFAIIVETFGQLRELKNERDEKLHNSCFICGVERHDFEKAGFNNSFYNHRFIDHHIQNYIHFIMAVLEQPPSADLGIEMHVRECIRTRDCSWIPIGLDQLYVHKQRESAEDKIARLASHSGNTGGDDLVMHVSSDNEDDDNERNGSPTQAQTTSDSIANPQLLETIQAMANKINVINTAILEQDTDHMPSNSHGAVSTPTAGGISPSRGRRVPVSSTTMRHNQLRGPQAHDVASLLTNRRVIGATPTSRSGGGAMITSASSDTVVATATNTNTTGGGNYTGNGEERKELL